LTKPIGFDLKINWFFRFDRKPVGEITDGLSRFAITSKGRQEMLKNGFPTTYLSRVA